LNKVRSDNKRKIEDKIYILREGSWKIYPTPDNNDLYRYLPLGQAFFVHAKDDTNFIFKKGTSGQQVTNHKNNFHKKSTYSRDEQFAIIASAIGKEDKVYFVKNENTTTEFDSDFDAYKLDPWVTYPNVFFILNDEAKTHAAICQQPESESITLGFNMYENTNNVVLSIDYAKGFSSIILEDKLNPNTFIELTKNQYTFDYNTDDDDDRFILHFNKGTLSTDIENDLELNIFNSKSNIFVESKKDVNVLDLTIFSMSGQTVIDKTFNNIKKLELNSNLNDGIYIVKINADGHISNKKITIINK
jgi:hypothetical protein